MMTDSLDGEVSTGCVPHIKKELDGFHECSPSNSEMYSSPTTTTVLNDSSIKSSKSEVTIVILFIFVLLIIFIK